MANLGKNFNTIFGSFVDDPKTELIEELKPDDLILKQTLAERTGRSKGETSVASGKFLMTENAYKAIKNYIESMDSTALQKAYIQYLPKNLMIQVGADNVVPINNRLNATFGFTTF
jgi:CRISPR/Cas system-associated endonuclease Cas1